MSEENTEKVLSIIDTVLDEVKADPFDIGEHLTDAEIDEIFAGTVPASLLAAQTAHLWESDGSHNDDPALVGGYGR